MFDWLGKIISKSEACSNPQAMCSVSGKRKIPDKYLIACPKDQYLSWPDIEELALSHTGERGGGGFNAGPKGSCNFCGRQGEMRPPVVETKTGLLCKQCVQVAFQLGYEKIAFPVMEFKARRDCSKQGLCYFCRKDKADITGAGRALLCYTCYDAFARAGKNHLIAEDYRCDLCLNSVKDKQGQLGVKGGVICAECLGRHREFIPPQRLASGRRVPR